MRFLKSWISVVCLLCLDAAALELRVWPDFYRPDPFGGLVADDWQGRPQPQPLFPNASGGVVLTAYRNGYVSFHLVVMNDQPMEFMLDARADGSGVEVDIFREWFHGRGGKYYPDALIPLRDRERLSLPDKEMKIDGQKAAAFWVDIWVAKKAGAGRHTIRIQLSAGGRNYMLPVLLQVLRTEVPDEDAVTADGNCYGLGWVGGYFRMRADKVRQSGRDFNGSDEFFSAVHDTHRLFYEHRGLFHDLGYNHSGGVTSVFAPEIEGSGRSKRIKSWDYFDRHFGPLLDGSAFKDARRGPRPIECMYLTINPEWPASYINWGTPAFEVEFVNIVSAMEQHFREKGWTQTDFEMFFNHKKRYKGFAWDGDETRFPKDNGYFKEFGRLLKAAVPKDSPVRFRFRHDASWLMRQQMDELVGVVNFWVCGGGIFAFYPEAPEMLKKRGDKVWIYGGTPSIFGSSAGILDLPVKSWMYGIDGYIRWLVTGASGGDPWFKSDGGGTTLFYPGHKFGLDEPLACVRMKLQRNCLQDIALLDYIGTHIGGDKVREAVAAFADAKANDWWNPDAAAKKLDPWEWSNASLGEAGRTIGIRNKTLDAFWWLKVREFITENLGRTGR